MHLGFGFPLGFGCFTNVAALSGGGAPSGPTFTWASGTSSANWGLSNANLTALASGIASGDALLRGSVGRSATGSAYYFELAVDSVTSGELFGLATAAQATTDYVNDAGLGYVKSGASGSIIRANTTLVSGIAVPTNGGIVGVLIDSGNAYVRLNGSWLGGCDGDARTGGFDISTLGTLYPAVSTSSGGNGAQVSIHTPASLPTGAAVW
jgi:hypothetical protein